MSDRMEAALRKSLETMTQTCKTLRDRYDAERAKRLAAEALLDEIADLVGGTVVAATNYMECRDGLSRIHAIILRERSK